jgi:hypothetical protein
MAANVLPRTYIRHRGPCGACDFGVTAGMGEPAAGCDSLPGHRDVCLAARGGISEQTYTETFGVPGRSGAAQWVRN